MEDRVDGTGSWQLEFVCHGSNFSFYLIRPKEFERELVVGASHY
jgi:hypothetical protein